MGPTDYDRTSLSSLFICVCGLSWLLSDWKYEPELFPGLIYRMKQPKIVLLIFVSGKIAVTGAKVRDETYTAFENIYPVLTEFRKVQQWYGISRISLSSFQLVG
ncbi:hypothetical protein Pint_26161 [Pistacia integerrima]|uniref:Uncharacterized protein n=1 Tax=Pistacia integerrima TaxID=434235 RepID=A0ACC0YFK0_9ROSI|nr:hypothetical protein Pint_26161 [Pistacia integerrima]